jgi:hypothetical protein
MACQVDRLSGGAKPRHSGPPHDAARRSLEARLVLLSEARMFVGHLSVGLLAKRAEPRISLGTWFFAALLADFAAFPLLIAGVESFGGSRLHIPYSHSLLTNALWAGLLAAAWFASRRSPGGAWLLFAAALTHWPLDAISHQPDMTLAPGFEPAIGLGLWSSLPATLLVEGGFWLAALVLYVRAARAKRRAGVLGFWIGAALLTLSWYSNVTKGADPNPVRAGIAGLIFFALVVAWGFWMNRARHIVLPSN